jgi:hypothetical protein
MTLDQAMNNDIDKLIEQLELAKLNKSYMGKVLELKKVMGCVDGTQFYWEEKLNSYMYDR